jgi:hypothetical protein
VGTAENTTQPSTIGATQGAAESQTSTFGAAEATRICPCCKQETLVKIGRLYPKQARGP